MRPSASMSQWHKAIRNVGQVYQVIVKNIGNTISQ